EFALVIAGSDVAAAEATIASLVGALARPFWIDEQVVQVGITAGLAHAPRDAQSRDELMRCGDLALRAAKKKQRGGIAYFEPALVELVSDTLARNGVAPSRLMLEVTEGVLIDNPDEAKARLDALKALGIRLALDDFGTGYSSLTYLQRFNFDKLKIDRGFVTP